MATSTTDKIQTLRCEHGEGHDWTRPSTRGKPPKYCPMHKAQKNGTHPPQSTIIGKAENIKGDTIVAQADAEQKAKALAKAREAAAKAREERKAREAQEAAQSAKDELARIISTMPDIEATYESALSKAVRTNKPEDWRAADGAQNRIIGMITRRRALQTQVAA